MGNKKVSREIRKDPISGNVSIQVSGIDDISALLTVDGKEIKLPSPLTKNGTIVRIFTPEKPLVPLFALEDPKAYGIDERLKLEKGSIVNGLELLIEAFIRRSVDLGKPPTPDKHPDLRRRQFYSYMTYDMVNSSLTGRLLVSKEIAPTIEREIQIAVAHYDANYDINLAHLKPTCLHCDVIRDPTKLLIIEDRPYYGTYRPKTQEPYGYYIIPKQHIPRFSDLANKKIREGGVIELEIREEEVKELARSIYALIERINEDPNMTSRYDAIHVVFHSAPFHYLRALERIYHPHVEILMGKNGKGDSLIIPGTGWEVTLLRQ